MTHSKILASTSMTLCLVIAAGCSSYDAPTGLYVPPASQPISTTSLVLALAKTSDDIGDPLSINDGAFAFNDTSEQSEPVPINN